MEAEKVEQEPERLSRAWWAKEYEKKTDEDIVSEWGRLGEAWKKPGAADDAALYSAEGVLSAILEHRGIMAPSAWELRWQMIDATQRKVEDAVEKAGASQEALLALRLAFRREGKDLHRKLQNMLVEFAEIYERRGQRIASGKFVYPKSKEPEIKDGD